MPIATSPPRLTTLVLLAGVSTLSLNLFLPSLPGIAAELEADYALVNLALGGYLAVTAVLMLVMGPLSDRFGRRPVMLTALAVYTGASLVCALATDIWVFLAFRLLQGAIVAGWGVSLAVIRDTAPEREAASLIGYVSMAMALAPMLAPMAGGVLDELFGWRASFWAFAGLGAGLFLLCWLDLGETNRTRSHTLAAQIESYPALFASRRFWGYALCMAFSIAAFHSFLSGAPLVGRTVLDLSPSTLGVTLGTTTAGFMLGSFLAGRTAKRYPLTALMIAGRLVACAGLLVGLALFLAGVVHLAPLVGAALCLGFGNGLTVPSSSAGALSVHPNLAGSASGLSGALTSGAGALFSAITGAVVTEATGAPVLLGMMLFCAAMGLVAALVVRWIDQREGKVLLPKPANR